MKRTNLLIAFLAIMLNYATLSAQSTFDVPQNVELKKAEDFAKYEKDVVAAEKWLETSDLDKEQDKRKQVSAFVTQWIIGSPDVSISLTGGVMKLYGDNADLLIIYMGSYASHYIENKGTATPLSANKAAVTSMMNVYKKGISIKKCKEMEKAIKMADEGKLEEYIKDKLK